TALLTPCPTGDFGHSHVRSVCKQTLGRAPVRTLTRPPLARRRRSSHAAFSERASAASASCYAMRSARPRPRSARRSRASRP
ncbi:hypothetical protein DF154_25420, partial [Burkholderia ubonensis]